MSTKHEQVQKSEDIQRDEGPYGGLDVDCISGEALVSAANKIAYVEGTILPFFGTFCGMLLY